MEFTYKSESNIVQAIRKREPAVFVYLRDRCFGPVRSMIRDNRGTNEDAEDIYGEGVAKLVKTIDDPAFVLKEKVFKLQMTICKRLWLDHLKKRKPDMSLEALEEEPETNEFTGEELDQNLFRNLFWRNFKKLKEDCQKIIKGVLDAIKYGEIASQMGLKPAYVKKRKHYCYKSLIESVQQDPDFEEFRKNLEGDENNYSL